MILLRTWACLWAAWRFRGYLPQKVTFRSVNTWLRQFPARNYRPLVRLLGNVMYFSEQDTRAALVELNRKRLDTLAEQGIPPDKVIYVQIDDAGSSSPVMLNMLRDSARLEGRGCKFCDSNHVGRLMELTYDLGEGAIIYVDDFAGTGDQFSRSRNRVAEFIRGRFAEFFLLPCICSEAVEKLDALGVQPVASHVHTCAERPLHEDCQVFDPETRERLRELCGEVVGEHGPGLGYKKLATMVVFYRNATNHIPSVLRGNRSQDRYKGVLPRTTDLPCEA